MAAIWPPWQYQSVSAGGSVTSPPCSSSTVQGDERAKEQLVERFLPLARHLARRYLSGPEREDVEQVAALGLLKAIERFDPHRGLAFTSFAVPTILGEVKRYFRDLGWSVRVPRSIQELVPKVEKATETLTGKLGHTPTAEEVAEYCEVSVEDVLEARGSASAHRADSLDRPVAEEGEASRGDLMGDVTPASRASSRPWTSSGC